MRHRPLARGEGSIGRSIRPAANSNHQQQRKQRRLGSGVVPRLLAREVGRSLGRRLVGALTIGAIWSRVGDEEEEEEAGDEEAEGAGLTSLKASFGKKAEGGEGRGGDEELRNWIDSRGS